MSLASDFYGITRSPSVLATNKGSTGGVTLQTGTPTVAGVTTSASSLDSYLTAVADLSSPDPWTSLVSLTGPAYIQFETHNILEMWVDENEGAGEGLAAKITIDGTVAFQAYVVKDTTAQSIICEALEMSAYANTDSYPIYIKSSLTIHGARKGDGFTDAGTKFVIEGYKIIQVS